MREELDDESGDDAHLEKREAQLTRMQDGLLCVVGDLQGIGQDAIPALDTLATSAGSRPSSIVIEFRSSASRP